MLVVYVLVCISAIQTSPASTIPSTPDPIILSSSSVSTWQHSTTSNSTPINTSPFRSDDKKTTEFVAILNPTHPKKPETTAESEQGKSASQVQTDNGYLGKNNNTLVGELGSYGY